MIGHSFTKNSEGPYAKEILELFHLAVMRQVAIVAEHTKQVEIYDQKIKEVFTNTAKDINGNDN